MSAPLAVSSSRSSRRDGHQPSPLGITYYQPASDNPLEKIFSSFKIVESKSPRSISRTFPLDVAHSL